MTPIGTKYTPGKSFEFRCGGTYQALMVRPYGDMLWLQQVLTAKPVKKNFFQRLRDK